MANMGPAPSSMSAASMNLSSASPQSYFTYPALSGLMLGHIVLMSVAWVFVLPVGKHIWNGDPSFPLILVCSRHAKRCAVSICSPCSAIFLGIALNWSVAWDSL